MMKPAPESPTAYLQDRPVLSPGQTRCLALLGPVLITVLGVLLARTALVNRLENMSLDRRFAARGADVPPGNIVIVEIDEASRRALATENRRFNLRPHLPAVINHLAEAGALVIAFDIYLTGKGDPTTDTAIAAAIADNNVILAVTHAGGMVKRAAPAVLAAEPDEGVITVYPDPDGVLRRFPENLYLDVAAGPGTLVRVPHFPLVASMYAIWEKQPEAEIEFTPIGALLGNHAVRGGELVNFTAPRGAGWRTLPFADVATGAFDADLVDGAIVLVGESRAITDTFTMPLTEGGTPGIYYHANAIAHILGNRGFDDAFARGFPQTAITGLLALAVGLFAWNQRRWWEHRRASLLLAAYLLAGVVVFVGGWTAIAFALFDRNVLVPLMGPLAAMVLALSSGLGVQWIVTSANARRLALRGQKIETLFGQSVSRTVLEALRASPQQIVETHVRDVSVLFCDLRGFTALSSILQPLQVADLLNEYFNHVAEAVFEEDGFLDKFVGDEIMAVFAAPLPQADHADRAVRAALRIKQHLTQLNRLREERGDVPLECGIGIHTGPAAAGHIGSKDRSNYTVVGTTVNLAARIEAFTSGGEILISQATRDHLTDASVATPWKKVDIRGATEPHHLYRINLTSNSTAPS